ncbi:intraflagellar transport complex B protein 46 carboxy-terminal protein (macronuclear) [Tetrahymena thermophila SB210]|uniref:Intraflagellar transport complex B protein 46 carboxy-terminal protein n=1 Tax=Tetrahymena thermophila (strain SB210) TaxID=312017 RepID=Q23KH7_TETTS|nr:intraflagellar transport complex B protein 46 carboxy-terminal protein [Tetrahymena thermophila SB210]EAR96866.2 intraflagellar transport complex B protein 46 carboxy-terminal protein [Tetrahymena thermophila SB210]|eukprot:XP_001017111.2 intraflagellar transport complex B protein 46 carboxy-terminal protein [Tetrahymena thermophila SB210]
MSDSDDRQIEDDDFEYKQKQNKDSKKGADIKAEKIENQHMDERIELDSEGQSEEIQSQEEEDHQDDKQDDSLQNSNQNKGKNAGRQNYNRTDEDEQDYEAKNTNIPGAYNPADYAHLDVSNEIKELFRYVQRYQPETKELDAKLKPFIPDYYPAIGEVDAYIKMPRPDKKDEILGLQILDEPCLNQSNKAVVTLKYGNSSKQKIDGKLVAIDAIQNAEKNPKQIQMWINNVAEIRKTKQPHSVSYTKPMPEIDELMQEWPQEIEEILQHLKIPSEELDFNLSDFCKLACAILDIPVHDQPNESNVIESLHVLFTLYSEFKSNQHFQQNKNDGNYDQMQLQIN